MYLNMQELQIELVIFEISTVFETTINVTNFGDIFYGWIYRPHLLVFVEYGA